MVGMPFFIFVSHFFQKYLVVSNSVRTFESTKEHKVFIHNQNQIKMTTTQLIYSDVNKAIKTLITNEALDAKHSKLEREYLKGNISPTTLDYKEAAKAALVDMMLNGDFQ